MNFVKTPQNLFHPSAAPCWWGVSASSFLSLLLRAKFCLYSWNHKWSLAVKNMFYLFFCAFLLICSEVVPAGCRSSCSPAAPSCFQRCAWRSPASTCSIIELKSRSGILLCAESGGRMNQPSSLLSGWKRSNADELHQAAAESGAQFQHHFRLAAHASFLKRLVFSWVEMVCGAVLFSAPFEATYVFPLCTDRSALPQFWLPFPLYSEAAERPACAICCLNKQDPGEPRL